MILSPAGAIAAAAADTDASLKSNKMDHQHWDQIIMVSGQPLLTIH